jgi:hypothetical protein
MTNARPEVGTGAVKCRPGSHTDGTADPRQNIADQLRRRRVASLRCEPMADGRRDPWSRRGIHAELSSERELNSWARALAHLGDVGLVGLPPAYVRRALAERRSAA